MGEEYMVMIPARFSFLIYVLMPLWYNRRKITQWSQEDNSNNYALQQHFTAQDFLTYSVQFTYFTTEIWALKINVPGEKRCIAGKDCQADNKLK